MKWLSTMLVLFCHGKEQRARMRDRPPPPGQK